MFYYLVRKYWKGTLLAVLFFQMGYGIYHNFDDAMSFMVCMGSLAWMTGLIVHGTRGNGKKLVSLATGLVNLLVIVWYVVSLKPLRRLVRRLRYIGLSPEPYPYLALYGSLADTQAMLHKFSLAPFYDKTPLTRAALWQLLVRGSLRFADGDKGPELQLGPWSDAPSDGIDQAFERTLYKFLCQAAQPGQAVTPKQLARVISYYSQKRKKTKQYDIDNQFRFADLLNTGLHLRAYTKTDIRNIWGMKRFLKGLPATREQLTGKGAELELRRVWPDYMAYAYLFGIEQRVIKRIASMLPADDGSAQDRLLRLLTTSKPHRRALKRMMAAATTATPMAEDAAAGYMGRFSFAWHVDEIYDI